MIEKIKSSILVLLLTATCLFCLDAQSAPDFTVTDSGGKVHRLYADYLNKGKTVVIKIFFVNCPPCVSIAPSFNALYSEWGSGFQDVQFLELSNKAWDSNADVQAYKTSLGLNYPGVGEDGGALTALQPYLNGTYGPFFGTPTFVVIAPDGSVNYDVSGPGNSGTINAIDQAIFATGAQKPGFMMEPTSFRVVVRDAFGIPVDGVELTLASAGSSNGIPISLGAGDIFEVTEFADDYPGIVNPVLRIEKTDEIEANLSAIDILIIVRHILGIIPITDNRLLLAADTNGDGSINAIDLITLQRVILKLIPGFPNSDSYEFFPREVPLDLDPGETVIINFDAVKIGDLNGF